MRKASFRAALCLLLSILLIAPPPARAWGNSGHEAVAYIAWKQLNDATRTRVLELLTHVPTLHNPKTGAVIPGYTEWVAELPAGVSVDQRNLYLFMRAATWADSIKHNGFTDSDVPPKGRAQEVHIGFTDKETHGYWHFVDTGFASDSSAVPATPAPNAATQIAALRQDIASGEDQVLEAYDLVWLEHLVGDVHQPLHGAVRFYQNQGDAGGNNVPVKLTIEMEHQFEGTLSKTAPTELHAFWDDLPGEGQPGPALAQAAAFADPLSSPTPPDSISTKVADIDPSDWAAESFALAKADAYAPPIGASPTASATGAAAAKPMAARQSASQRQAGTPYQMTPGYYDQALQDAKDRITLAGARLAKLLNENLK